MRRAVSNAIQTWVGEIFSLIESVLNPPISDRNQLTEENDDFNINKPKAELTAVFLIKLAQTMARHFPG
ncbi:hypothetical protein RRG08_021556 [Elysia crispata]|uniref:Uncharacterized protein n=1 Tax=Elysia crispata TaxID=231223 RepID=A0AAE0XDL9_9GAST|nr:hypothetical protein RRG08_021556 [Elysia crispata]